MDWSTVENKVNKRTKLLVAISGVVSTIVSLLYLLSAVLPLHYFHGYVEGYYSIVDYRLHYMYNQHLVSMPNSDYIKHVSLTYTFLSLALLVLSLTSIALIKQKPYVASGLAYGVASGLGVLYGLLNGYIYRAIASDLGRFSYLLGDEITYRTLAGTITFEGIKIEPTLVYEIVFASPVLLALLTIAVLTSALATGLTLYIFHKYGSKYMEKQKTRKQLPGIRHVPAYTTLALTSLTLLATVFTYYPSTITISPQPPPATLETPPYMYTCVNLSRTARGALVYTDFETYPLPGWNTSGGVWSLVSGVIGAKGNVLQGQDNGGGIGDASYYYYNTRLDGYSSLWIAVKARRVARNDWFGISLINSALNRVYLIGVEDDRKEIEIRSFNVEGANAWRTLAQTRFTYVRGNWYIIVANYVVTATSVAFTAWVYNEYGDFLVSISASSTSPNRFAPAYIGVVVDNPTAQFDEFIISTVDPRSILFTGFTTGMRVEVWDNLGYLVNSTTAPAPSFYLNVTSDTVVGTGVDGRIVVGYPDSQLCGVLTVSATDAVLGGDAYALTTRSLTLIQGANKTSANLTVYISGSPVFNTTTRFLRISTTQLYYARLILYNASATSGLNIDLWIEGATRSTNITIRDEVLLSNSTGIVQLNLGPGNTIVISGHSTLGVYHYTLLFKLELCTAPGGTGACVYYPITLYLYTSLS